MEKDRDTRFIAIVALIIGVICLSLGFATYTLDYILEQTHHLESFGGLGDFDVSFSTDQNTEKDGPIEGVPDGGAEGGTATITKNSVIEVNALFTAPGQSVTFTFYNVNKYNGDAFLNAVVYENIKNSTKNKICTNRGDATEAYVQAACESIGVTVKAGKDTFTTSKGDVDGHILPKNDYEVITITVYYKEDGARADGAFKVEFGNIALSYSIVD